MPRNTPVKPYRWLAEYYDRMFGEMRTPIDAARRRLLRQILPKVETACDLACGTGITAVDFARKGIRTYGVDLSPRMCRAARERATRARLPICIIRADMRNFRLPEAVELITCEYDALNHIARRSDLKLVARSVARALQPGGRFFFDVNNSAAFKGYWAGSFWLEQPGVVMVMRSGHNAAASRAWSDVEWFIRSGACWHRHTERVEEVCWTEDEITRALESSGFDQVQSWDAAPFFKNSPVIVAGCRTIYLARKSSNA